MSTFDLVVVGGGFTGACFLIHYSQNPANLHKKIAFIDPKPTGRGPAYQKNNSNLLLNVPASRMSLYPDIPTDFTNWLNLKQYKFGIYDFVPRSIYGDYIQETLEEKIKLFSAIKIYKNEVIGLKPEKSGYVLALNNQEILNANQVLLSLGSPPPTSPSSLQGHINDPHYIANPCEISQIDKIPKDQAVFILGKGLTALDLLQLFINHQAPVILQSRHGRFPRPHLELNDELVKQLAQITFDFSPSPTLLELVTKFKHKIRQEKVPWQLAMDVLRHQVPKIWPKLSVKDKKKFLSNLKPIWNVHRHRSPVAILKLVEICLQQKKIEIIKGEVESIQKSDSVFRVSVKTAGGSISRDIKWIINATGPNYNIHTHSSPLIKQLLKDQILISDQLNFGVSITDDHQLLKNLFFIGPLTLSRYLEATSVPDLRNQAKQLALKLSQ